MTDQSLLIAGASGQLGAAIARHVQQHRPDLDLHLAARSSADPSLVFRLEEPDGVRALIERLRPEFLILTAGATNVAWCEADPRGSRLVNIDGVEAAAGACRALGNPMAFLSTDYVFDGTHAPSGEGDPTSPLNEYGRQKLEGEQIVLGADAGNLVIRTCQVFGPDPRRANFVLRTIDQLRAEGATEAPDDMYGTPTSAEDLAHAIVELTTTGRSGVWHVAGEAFLSRYDLAVAAARAFGLPGAGVRRGSVAKSSDTVPRPRRAGLRNDRMHQEGLNWMSPLEEALAAMARADGAT